LGWEGAGTNTRRKGGGDMRLGESEGRAGKGMLEKNEK